MEVCTCLFSYLFVTLNLRFCSSCGMNFVVVVRSAGPCLHHPPRRPVLGHLSPFDPLLQVLLSTCALSTKKTKKTKKMKKTKKTVKALLPMKGWMWPFFQLLRKIRSSYPLYLALYISITPSNT